MADHLGPDVVHRPGYCDAPIEVSVVMNAPLAAQSSGLADPPDDLAGFVEPASAVVRPERIASLLEAA
jgi:hypothetical protein